MKILLNWFRGVIEITILRQLCLLKQGRTRILSRANFFCKNKLLIAKKKLGVMTSWCKGKKEVKF